MAFTVGEDAGHLDPISGLPPLPPPLCRFFRQKVPNDVQQSTLPPSLQQFHMNGRRPRDAATPQVAVVEMAEEL